MAPELLTGRKCNNSVDIYSFGVSRAGGGQSASLPGGRACKPALQPVTGLHQKGSKWPALSHPGS